MKKFTVTVVVVLSISTYGCGGTSGNGIVIREASGVVRSGDKLLIVGDDADGMYFEFDLAGNAGPIIPINPKRVRANPLPGAELALDIEAIDILADGRIAVLSEQTRCLISTADIDANRYTVIVEYDRTLSEFGHRGLEGLAVAHLADGRSRIAVLWEGGYPEYDDVPPELRAQVGRLPLKPIVVVHELDRGETAGGVLDNSRRITLDVPEPPGEPPEAQRYRATDLVWHRTGEGTEWQLIVAMNSHNSPAGGDAEYRYKILQRFNLQGEPVGRPINTTDICITLFGDLHERDLEGMDETMSSHVMTVASLLKDANWENVNWEGLGWFVNGESLIVIYDAVPLDPPLALIVDIPRAWK